MKFTLITAIAFFLIATSGLAQAQLSPDYQAARNNSGGLSALFGGGNGTSGSNGGGLGNLLQTFNLNRTPGIDMPQTPAGDGLGGSLPSLQGLLPTLGGLGGIGNGNQNPNMGTDMLSRMNQKSKSIIDRTTGWARQKKQEMSQKMLGNALGGLLPGLKPQQQQSSAKSAFDWLKPKGFQPPTQPPLRSAQNYEQQPGIRY